MIHIFVALIGLTILFSLLPFAVWGLKEKAREVLNRSRAHRVMKWLKPSIPVWQVSTIQLYCHESDLRMELSVPLHHYLTDLIQNGTTESTPILVRPPSWIYWVWRYTVGHDDINVPAYPAPRQHYRKTYLVPEVGYNYRYDSNPDYFDRIQICLFTRKV